MRKLIISLAVVVFGSSACVPGSSPIRIVGTFSVNTGMNNNECNLDDDVGRYAGRLDASGGGDFMLVFAVNNEMNAQQQILNDRNVPLTTVGKRNFILESLQLTYRSTPVIQFEAEQIPMYGVIAPSTLDNRLLVDIIGDKAAARLREQVTDREATVQLTVNATLKGRTEQGETLVSNTVTFPIEVFTSDSQCTDGVVRDGPCGSRGGQAGFPPTCCMTGPGTCN
ncbi:MAG: hypothetical protein JNK82_17775 [Myxococcaceae bacterium]|nr:hypothetical protein [Myxococcaceae bacterium]